MESNEAPICPLCRHEKVKIWAAGDCGHPVCHLCSTKMRILCEQTYCAICRQELPRVRRETCFFLSHNNSLFKCSIGLFRFESG